MSEGPVSTLSRKPRTYCAKTTLIICVLFSSCGKSNSEYPFDVPLAPYQYPVWHPDGRLLGYIYNDLNSTDPNSYSTFWIINSDGTGRKQLSRTNIYHPAWSPDGQWLAYSTGKYLFKMKFDGNSLDTSHPVQLTTEGSGVNYCSWSADGKTIYYDKAYADYPGGFGGIYKVSSSGTGLPDYLDSTELQVFEPVTYTSGLLHVRVTIGGIRQLFTMDTLGEHVRQITFGDSANYTKDNPLFFNGRLYYESVGIRSINLDGSDEQTITPNSFNGFSISKTGEIVYVNQFVFGGHPESNIDKHHGYLWLMNTDGSNNHQLTFP